MWIHLNEIRWIGSSSTPALLDHFGVFTSRLALRPFHCCFRSTSYIAFLHDRSDHAHSFLYIIVFQTMTYSSLFIQCIKFLIGWMESCLGSWSIAMLPFIIKWSGVHLWCGVLAALDREQMRVAEDFDLLYRCYTASRNLSCIPVRYGKFQNKYYPVTFQRNYS